MGAEEQKASFVAGFIARQAGRANDTNKKDFIPEQFAGDSEQADK